MVIEATNSARGRPISSQVWRIRILPLLASCCRARQKLSPYVKMQALSARVAIAKAPVAAARRLRASSRWCAGAAAHFPPVSCSFSLSSF
jgi:hypothetical protein